MRVHELAKKLGINSKQLMDQLHKQGLDIKNHMSVVPAETIDHYLQVATSIKEKEAAKTAPSMPAAAVKKPMEHAKAPVKLEHAKAPVRHKEAVKFKEPIKEKITQEAPKAPKKEPPHLGPIEIMEGMTLKELAQQMNIKSSEIMTYLISQGQMVTINKVLDEELARKIIEHFGFTPKIISLEVVKEEAPEITAEEKQNLLPRPPVVTIMGHVDHGKTLLLDSIRKTDIVSGEAGGITQHIGAYKVKLPDGEVTFLDTPGHEAFTAMRARGAHVTDIVVLVVAADDGVMPQTIEAINHAREAHVPIIVAVNKIDKPEANGERVRQELTKYELVPEEWGGKTIFVDVSAKKKIGLEQLLEMLLLESEMLELKANPSKSALGTIIEAKLDKGRGPVATVLVQDGTLKVGDPFVCGINYGKVRALINDKGEKIEKAAPATPVEVLGFSGVPMAGDNFAVVADERKGHQIALMRQQKERETTLGKKSSRITLEDLHAQISTGEVKELKVIIKADVQGSIEAIADSLTKLVSEKIQVKIIHGGVGAINEMDVMLASASNAIIVGFNVRPQPKAAQLAVSEGVDIRSYTIIYNLISDIKSAMEGLLTPEYKEIITGRAIAKEVFHLSKVGNIAGSLVQEGKILRNSHARLLRDNIVVYEGTIETLRRFKDDVKEVASGYECGIKLNNFNDIKQGDIIEAFNFEQLTPQL